MLWYIRIRYNYLVLHLVASHLDKILRFKFKNTSFVKWSQGTLFTQNNFCLLLGLQLYAAKVQECIKVLTSLSLAIATICSKCARMYKSSYLLLFQLYAAKVQECIKVLTSLSLSIATIRSKSTIMYKRAYKFSLAISTIRSNSARVYT